MTRRPSLNVDEKQQVVLSVLRGECSEEEAARRNGCSEPSVKKWREQFVQGGLTALEDVGSLKRLSGWLKRHFVALLGSLVAILTLFDFLGWSPVRLWSFATWYTWDRHTSLPTCNHSAWLSALQPQGAFAYYYPHPEQHNAWLTIGTAQDEAWEGRYLASSNDWISWTFGHSENLTLFCVRNGWDRDINTYYDTGRLKSIILTGCDHTTLPSKCHCHTNIAKPVTLPDSFQPGMYDTEGLDCRAQTVTLWMVKGFYPGARYQPDALYPAISHVEFYSDDIPEF